jgi:alpha-maltose-1-phosphate synthase
VKVSLLTREFPPEVYGGAGVHVEYLARELASLVELGVHCFGAPRESPLVAGSYQPWDALAGGGPHRSALRTMSADLAIAAGVEGTDLVHSHTWYANLAGHLAKLLYDVPHVATTHSLEPLRPWKAEQLGGGYALSSFCERTGLEHADAVIAVSQQMRDDVLRAYPAVDPERVAVIHNGIDPDEYAPDHGTDVLTSRGIDPERPSVVFVGRITRQKGLVHLLHAARDIDPEAQLVLCAGAPDTPEMAAEVRDLVAEVEATRGGVVWIEEMLGRDRVAQILTHATVFVCPSIYEPFGLVNLEAMACEAAVVASAVGGIPEVVVDGETGFLVDFEPGDDAFGSPRDPGRFAADLAARVNALLADP